MRDVWHSSIAKSSSDLPFPWVTANPPGVNHTGGCARPRPKVSVSVRTCGVFSQDLIAGISRFSAEAWMSTRGIRAQLLQSEEEWAARTDILSRHLADLVDAYSAPGATCGIEIGCQRGGLTDQMGRRLVHPFELVRIADVAGLIDKHGDAQAVMALVQRPLGGLIALASEHLRCTPRRPRRQERGGHGCAPPSTWRCSIPSCATPA